MPSPVTLKIKFKAANLQQFIERYAVDVSKGGIFIRTPKPLAVGTALKFEFQLQDGAPLLAGNGTVVWIREPDPSKGGGAPGMGVRFDQLPPDSQGILEDLLARKQRAAQAAEFHEQPTRVADLPLADMGAPIDEPEPPVRPQPVEARGAGTKDTSRRITPFVEEQPAVTPAEPSALTAEPPAPPTSAPAEAAPAAETQPEEEEPPPPPPDEPAAQAAVSQPAVDEPFDVAERKERLEKILFSSDGQPRDMTDEEGGAGDYTQPATAREPRSSALLWVIILIVLGASGFLAFKFLGGKKDQKTQDHTQAATASDSAPPVEQPRGIALKVESEPAGARVLLDGKETGKTTPAELQDLELDKEVEIGLDLAGKKLFTTKVKPQPDQPLRASLENSERRIQFLSEPAGATILLDGKKLGKTPLDYKKPINFAKPHELVFTLPGHVDARRTLNDEGWTRDGENELLTVSVSLEKKGAKPEPKAEPKPKIIRRPRPKVEPGPDPEPKTEPEPKVEPKPAPKVEPKPEPKVETKPEPKPKPEVKEEGKGGVKKPSWLE